jgi:hypothetical protein
MPVPQVPHTLMHELDVAPQELEVALEGQQPYSLPMRAAR